MKSSLVNRREFLKMAGIGFSAFLSGGIRAIGSEGVGRFSALGDVGTLLPPDANGICLPPGFRSRIVARSGTSPVDGAQVWHGAPDGGGVFAQSDGGWIYVSNSEISGRGGVGALRFNSSGALIDSYPILENTTWNCAGGTTPWGTWLSCEETRTGQVYECDPTGRDPAVARPALGVFSHEAVAVDEATGYLFLTEDRPDGGFYRFVPSSGLPDISSGRLEIAEVREDGGESIVIWHEVPDPLAKSTSTRKQVQSYSPFRGGEGVVIHERTVFFSTKRDNRVWAYNIESHQLSLAYDLATSASPILSGVDNLAITPTGDVLVAEDGGHMQLIALTSDERVMPILQVVGHDRSEITGPAFDPSFERLYFSSQRGSGGTSADGVTYEIAYLES